ncbi:hypothetical protein L226DRAFT_610647 [Lentinus tigrinus ALCF2SS1-7]|uniref:Transmembrane protein n=1 Tax=Lentinus tigrinus ALCF2SS1-6 TaxID=1328759 RepID=A0A5C2S2C9_9APHY|nr:hypothetical protein L227DRAFT_655456 [Lentinus tigrinus ALCF2SS1-6]RPD78815.1 hypothetical protein L226DRAFT_610647 [Lentinus tigrinus ALCF2SS1-7]
MNTVHVLAAVVPTRQFSNVGMEVLSSMIHLLGVSILSYMLALKLKPSDITPLGLSHITWPRFLILMNLLDSWAFLFTTGILVHGTGMELSGTVCLLGILNCIIFYASSKVIIYLFLAEKVFVVWNPHRQRFRSKIYMACLGFIVVYLGVMAFLIWGRIALFRDDGACVIGLARPASLTLLIYDLCINVLLTSLFVWPLLKRDFTTALKGVAVRTLWAAGVALTTSCINILVLTIMHGRQLAWVCLASCGTDVVVNAIVLCWVTSGKYERESEYSRDPSSHGDPKLHPSNVVFYSSTTASAGDFPHAAEPPRSAIRSPFPNVFAGVRPRGWSTSKSMSMRTQTDPDVELVRVGRSQTQSVDSDRDTSDTGSKLPAEDLIIESTVSLNSPAVSPAVSVSHRSTPLLRPPLRTHESTMRRSNMALSRHAGPGPVSPELEVPAQVHPPAMDASSPTARSSQGLPAMQIVVTRQTDPFPGFRVGLREE